MPKTTNEATTTAIRVVVATATFHAPDGVLVITGNLYDDTHPIVRTHTTHFRPVEDIAIREQTNN